MKPFKAKYLIALPFCCCRLFVPCSWDRYGHGSHVTRDEKVTGRHVHTTENVRVADQV